MLSAFRSIKSFINNMQILQTVSFGSLNLHHFKLPYTLSQPCPERNNGANLKPQTLMLEQTFFVSKFVSEQ